MSEFSSDWLSLREPADAAARAAALAEAVAAAAAGTLVIRDLGCGTGSLGRWLAPRLPGPQHWILEDRDPALLDVAAARLPGTAADGRPVTVETRRGDVTALTGDDLAGVSLVTCSALLDILTADELDGIAAALAVHGTTALLTLSVVGDVTVEPADPLDAPIAAAFNAHQRRTVGGRRLLGPDAPTVATDVLSRYGAKVTARPSPWRLGSERAALTGAWLDGWLAAAAEQAPDLVLDDYRKRRQADLGGGSLMITVGHQDLLVEFR
jgi:SAM-dependent methyltransferase